MVQLTANSPAQLGSPGEAPGLWSVLHIGWAVESSAVSGWAGRGEVELDFELELGGRPRVRAIRWPLAGGGERPVASMTAEPVAIDVTQDELGNIHLEARDTLRATIRPGRAGVPARLLWASTPLLTQLGVRGGGAESPTLRPHG